MKIHHLGRLISGVTAMLCGLAGATDQYWSGSTTGDVSFSDADGTNIVVNGSVNAATAVFNVSGYMTLSKGGGGKIVSLDRFVKRGSGTLEVTDGTLNYSTNTIVVEEGVLRGGIANSFNNFGDSKREYLVEVMPGATFWPSQRNVFGSDGSGANTRIMVHTNGVFSMALGDEATQYQMFKSVDLDGGSFVIPEHGNTRGIFTIMERMSFAGNQPYIFASNGVPTSLQFVNLSTNVEFRVADITGDSSADVTFALPITFPLDWMDPEKQFDGQYGAPANRFGFTKTGPGKMAIASSSLFNSSANKPLNGPIEVREGTLALTAQTVVDSYSDCALRVNTNATLEVGCDAFTPSAKITTNVAYRSFVFDHCSAVFDSQGSESCMAFGDLTIDHADIDWSAWTPNVNLGGYSLYGKFSLRGSSQFTFVDKGRISLLAAPHATEFDIPNLTGDDSPDCIIPCMLTSQRDELHKNWRSGTGFVKSGEGVLSLTYTLNGLDGDIDIRGGSVWVGPDDQHHAAGQNYLGKMSVERTVTVRSGASLYLPNRNCFGTQQGITNNSLKAVFVFDGGTLTNHSAQGFLLPDLTFFNGGKIARGSGVSGYGRFMCAERFTVAGAQQPFEWNLNKPVSDYQSDAEMSFEALSLNGYPENIFTIDDVTDSPAVDANFGIPFIIGNGFFRKDTADGNHLLSDWAFGFTKAGSGTMRISAPKLGVQNSSNPGGFVCRGFNGDAKVVAGTLQVDGDLSLSDTVRVSSGAYLAGTGTVNNVVLASGAGLRVVAEQTESVAVNGDLSVGPGLVLAVDAPDGFDITRFKAPLMSVAGTVTGAENFENATVTVNGAVQPNIALKFSDSRLYACYMRGTVLLVR